MTQDQKDKVYKGTGLYWGFLAVLLMLVALVVLAAQNTDPVSFRFLFWELNYPLIAIILAVVGVTVLLDELVGWVWRRRRRKVLAEREELRRLRAEKQAAEKAQAAAAQADADAEKARAKARSEADKARAKTAKRTEPSAARTEQPSPEPGAPVGTKPAETAPAEKASESTEADGAQ